MTLSARLRVVNRSEAVANFIDFLEDGFILEECAGLWFRTLFGRFTLLNKPVGKVIKTVCRSFSDRWLRTIDLLAPAFVFWQLEGLLSC